MTREEATKWFERMKEGIFPFSEEVMSEICDKAIKALSENKGEPIECARTLKKHCSNITDCKECFMWDKCKYELLAPCDWDLPESEDKE